MILPFFRDTCSAGSNPRRGLRRTNAGTAMTITDGQQVSNVALKMARGAVIAGTIRDEFGQPLPGARVSVLQYRMQNGERTLVPVAAVGPLGDGTDDLGAYRIFGLPPDNG